MCEKCYTVITINMKISFDIRTMGYDLLAYG